ncbi:protein-tyrosine-phosphatase [Joostella atrarenae]|uniref:Protein-tyrosine-phosphatase n=1 Tax=Joostella atrarenae TaxID=679257 RepID=A0ABS9J1H8_9FLAO|nr:protein-tyrosine-phosphatase [Joostella atrarenae]MCF8714224.1 protein-tyrosine-phosphatase [Joostella atrarenae]
MYQDIQDVIASFSGNNVPNERKEILNSLVNFINDKYADSKQVNINFICTHNSRRSHLSQVWAQAMANYFDLKNIYCYSGGTEQTAMFPMVAETLKSSGFKVNPISEGDNPVYTIKYSANNHPIIAFSKKYDDVFNPESGFAAIMTCSQADSGCPFIAGAEKRIPITYEDPKAFDGTPEQKEKYQERSLQIAEEMYYVFSNINK